MSDDRDRSWYAARECNDLRNGRPCRYDAGEEGECWYGKHPEQYKRGIICPFAECDGAKCGGYAHRNLLCPEVAAGHECKQRRCRFGHEAAALPCPDALRGEMCRYELHCRCEPPEEGEEFAHYGDCDFLVAPAEIVEGRCAYDHACPELARGKTCPRYASGKGCFFAHDPELARGHLCPLVESGRVCRLDLDARCPFKHPSGDTRWAQYKAIRCNKSRRDPDSSCTHECPYGHCPKTRCLDCNGRKEFPWANLCLECAEELGDHPLAKADLKRRCRVERTVAYEKQVEDDEGELAAERRTRVKRCERMAAHQGKLRMCQACYDRVADLEYQDGDQVTEQELRLFAKDAKKRQEKSRRAKREAKQRAAAESDNPYALLD